MAAQMSRATAMSTSFQGRLPSWRRGPHLGGRGALCALNYSSKGAGWYGEDDARAGAEDDLPAVQGSTRRTVHRDARAARSGAPAATRGVLAVVREGAAMSDEVVQTGNACLVCWRSPTDRAHLIDRSLCPDPYSDPRRIVYLCREHHDAYDAHELDLLPYLDRHRSELARAVELVGLITTLERVTGSSWRPMREETAIARDIQQIGGWRNA